MIILALCLFLDSNMEKYLYIEDSVGISNRTTKPVERSQNSSDLYPTWYTKYERSACLVGEGGTEVEHIAATDKIL